MREKMISQRKKWWWIIPVAVVLLFCIVFLIYTGNYYHADESSKDALESDDTVKVVQTDYGWLFDGLLKRMR